MSHAYAIFTFMTWPFIGVPGKEVISALLHVFKRHRCNVSFPSKDLGHFLVNRVSGDPAALPHRIYEGVQRGPGSEEINHSGCLPVTKVTFGVSLTVILIESALP